MALIGKNIRKIRSVKKLSQQGFADLFSISRASVGSYEEGRAEPKTPLIVEIANKFSVPIQDLIEKELKVNDISGFKDENLISENQLVRREAQIPVVDSRYFTEKGFTSRKHISAPKTYSVDIAFELEDNSLLDNHLGRLKKEDVLFAKKISKVNIDELETGKVYIVFTDQGVFPRYLGFAQNKIVLRAKHPFYEDLQIAIEEIKQIFSVEWFLSRA